MRYVSVPDINQSCSKAVVQSGAVVFRASVTAGRVWFLSLVKMDSAGVATPISKRGGFGIRLGLLIHNSFSSLFLPTDLCDSVVLVNYTA
jgi:hypothetical protein